MISPTWSAFAKGRTFQSYPPNWPSCACVVEMVVPYRDVSHAGQIHGAAEGEGVAPATDAVAAADAVALTDGVIEGTAPSDGDALADGAMHSVPGA